MSPEDQEERRWPAPLAGRVAGNADAGQIADAVVAIWLEIDQSLHPVIGHRGVAALFNRSLKLTAAAYPWLAAGHRGALAAVDSSALRAALVQRTAAEAGAGCCALFDSFHALLASLVGPALTSRLLRTAWARPSGDPPAQDTPS